MASVGVLQGLCYFVQYCVLVAQLFPHPHLTPHRQHTVPIISAFSSASSRISQGEQCISTYIVTNGNQGAIHALSHWHESFYTHFLARNFVLQSVGLYRSLFGCLCRPLYGEQLTRDAERTVLSVAIQKYSYEQALCSAGHSV
jgi:hypothetical protein